MTSVRTKVKSPVSLSYTVSATGGFAVTVNWNAKESAWPASYYVLYRKGPEDDDFSLIATDLVVTNYRDAGVAEGIEYEYAVATVNVHEIESGDSDPLLVPIPSFPVWDSGWSLSINQSATADIANRASDPDGGSLTFSRNGGTAPAGVTVSSAGIVSVGSSTAGSYTIILRATNASLSSDTTVSLSINAVGVALPPLNYNATTASSAQINHSWQAPSGGSPPTGYELDRSPNGTTGWVSRSTALVTSFNDTGLSPSTEYFYRLRTLTAVGPSTYVTDSATTSAPSQSDTPDYPDPVSGVTILGGRTTVNVSTAAQLITALSDAVAGQTIQLAAGTYAGNFTVSKSFAANNPLIIKGAANFASIFGGTFTMSGARNILTGVLFQGASSRCTLQGINNKCIANKFTGWGAGNGSNAIVPQSPDNASRDCEIGYCELYSPRAWDPPSSVTQNRVGIRSNDDNHIDFHYGAWIHHCYFHDFPDKPVPTQYSSGQDDAIEPGQTQSGTMPQINSGWYIEFNLIKDHLQGQQIGAGTIDWKVSGGVFRHNTADNVFGRFDIRGSSLYPMIWEGNWIQSSSKGSVFHGSGGGGHVIIGNRYVNTQANMNLQAGNIEADENPVTHSNFPGGGHAASRDVKVYANDIAGTLIVGLQQSSDRTIRADGTIIRQHNQGAGTGAISLRHHENTSNLPTQATTRNYRPAFRLFPADVGPDALSSASAAYKAARGIT